MSEKSEMNSPTRVDANRVSVKQSGHVGYWDFSFAEKIAGGINTIGFVVDFVPQGTEAPASVLHVEHETAQKVIDSLWRQGLRPYDYQEPKREESSYESELTYLRKLMDRATRFAFGDDK